MRTGESLSGEQRPIPELAPQITKDLLRHDRFRIESSQHLVQSGEARGDAAVQLAEDNSAVVAENDLACDRAALLAAGPA